MRDRDASAHGFDPTHATRLGRRGEELAARHLEARGWTVLERNYRAGRKEVDLVARKGDVVAFVEVKSRSTHGFGDPLESITWKKRREIAEVARSWRRHHPRGHPVLRFDAVAVHFGGVGAPRIEHLEDAWRLG